MWCRQVWCRSGPVPGAEAPWVICGRLCVEGLPWGKQGLAAFSAPKHCASRELCWLSPLIERSWARGSWSEEKGAWDWFPDCLTHGAWSSASGHISRGSSCSESGLPALLLQHSHKMSLRWAEVCGTERASRSCVHVLCSGCVSVHVLQIQTLILPCRFHRTAHALNTAHWTLIYGNFVSQLYGCSSCNKHVLQKYKKTYLEVCWFVWGFFFF